jgi:ribonuclease HI
MGTLARMAKPARPVLTPEQVLERYRDGPRTGIFTDGSCEGNPGPGGWAFVWVEDDRIVTQKHGFDPQTTNNRMELSALIEAYRVIPQDSDLHVYSDSQLCVRTINEWAAGWEQRGWRRKSGPIANLELVKELYALAGDRPGVTLEWIRAHDGSRWNEYADALASSFMRSA